MKRNIEDIYPLSDLQEAILIHRQRAAASDRTVDTGFLLLQGSLAGELDRDLFRRAWAETVAAHAILRSSVHWENLERPVQLVTRSIDALLDFDDWSALDAAERSESWARRIEAVRAAGVDLGRLPLLGLHVVRFSEREHRWLWPCHHILVDGWSSAIVLSELIERYEAARRGVDFDAPDRRPFREYVAWQRALPDLEPAEVLDVFEPAALLDAPYLSGADFRVGLRIDGSLESSLSEVTPSAIDAWARRHRVTASTLFLGAWGLVLAEATGTDRPTLGFTTSGRSTGFPGLEGMVGMFANTLPLQLSLIPDCGVAAWFSRVLEAQQGMQPFEARSLVQLMRAGGVALRRAPFDTLLAYASFPLGSISGSTAGSSLEISDFRAGVTSGYPLTLAIRPPLEPDGAIGIEAHYATSLFDESEIRALIDRFHALVFGITAGACETVTALLETAEGDLSRLPRFRELSRRDRAVSVAARPLGGTGAVSPESATEAQVMRIWNDLVDVQEYGVEDNFFSLGGHSLLVPQMIERVRQDFDVELPLGAIVETPTVRGLAAVINALVGGASGSQVSWPCLVRVRSGGQETPLFMVHGLGGEVGWFYNLANYLDPAVPLCGLQAPAEPHSDLVEMARRYVSEVRREQSSGPYRLGGYCVGGGVAYEMAQQLRAVGEEIEVLVLIDSVPQAHAFGDANGSTFGRIVGRLRRLSRKGPREIASSVADAARAGTRSVARRVSKSGASASRSLELADVLDMRTLPRVYHHASEQHFRAMRDYVPQPYAGDIWLFRTGETRFGEDFGWGSLVEGELRVEVVDGRHIDVLKEPHVQGLGRKLSEALESVSPRRNGSLVGRDSRAFE